MDISFGNGIAVKFNGNTILLDPKVADFTSFVSHAHADHSPTHVIKKPYCTEETCELIKLRDPSFHANIAKENKKIKFDDFSVKLLSAGHMLGSTQTFIEADGHSILYTGDFKMWQGLTCKAIDIRQADILITEATYGRPDFSFPFVEDVRKQLICWVREQLRKGFDVNLGGYTSGKSQEIIKLLNRYGFTPQVSDTIRRYCDVYNKFDANLNLLDRNEETRISVSPMHISFTKNRKVKSCILTGWSMFKNYNVFGLPLSDHCDFNQIMLFIQHVNPKMVFCVHGYAADLAHEIRKRMKIPAYALTRRGQKSLIDF
jgi:DNA ligase-1